MEQDHPDWAAKGTKLQNKVLLLKFERIQTNMVWETLLY